MLRQDRPKTALHLFAVRYFIERALHQRANNLFDELIVRVAFDHLHQLQGRFAKLNALRRRVVQCSVYYVRPVDQRLQAGVFEFKLRARDVGYELRA